MAEEEAVLFANEAFYRAFADRDNEAMVAIWAAVAPVACIHPGWAPLLGRDAVLESWHTILGGGHSPDIRCQGARAFLMNGGAFVVCYERIGTNFLIATNLFVKEDGAWKMVHHQAGPTPPPAPTGEPAEDPSPETVH